MQYLKKIFLTACFSLLVSNPSFAPPTITSSSDSADDVAPLPRASARSSVPVGADDDEDQSGGNNEAKRKRREEFLATELPRTFRLYKAQRNADTFDTYLRNPITLSESSDEEEEETEITIRKRRLDDNTGNAAGATNKFSLVVVKKTRSLPAHENKVAIFAGFTPTTTKHEEFKSLYFVRTQKGNVYVASIGGVGLLEKKELNKKFGFSVKERLKLRSLRRDKFLNLQSSLHPAETRAYRRPAHPKLEHAGTRIFVQKSQAFSVIKGNFKTLEKDGEIAVTFNADNITPHASCRIADLPSVCEDIDSILEKSSIAPKGAAVLVENPAEIAELNKELIKHIKNPEISAKLKWALLPRKLSKDEKTYRKVGIFSSSKKKGYSDSCYPTSYPNTEKALEALTPKLAQLSNDELTALTLRGFSVSQEERGKPHNVFKSFMEARFRHKFQGKTHEYFLNAGEWYVLPNSYSIAEEFKSLDSVSLDMKFKPATDKNAQGNESEGAFNFRQALEKPETLLLTDRLMIPHEFEGWASEAKSFEPFDLIDVKEKRLITIKVGTGGEGTNHLVWQANIAAVRLLNPVHRNWTLHYTGLCDSLKVILKTKKQEDFFNERQGIPPVQGNQTNTLKAFAYELLTNVYGDKKEVTTKYFKTALKAQLPPLFSSLSQQEIEAAIDESFKKTAVFFSGYDPSTITVVLGFITNPTKKISSSNVQESVYDGLKRIEQFGYKTAISYIPKK